MDSVVPNTGAHLPSSLKGGRDEDPMKYIVNGQEAFKLYSERGIPREMIAAYAVAAGCDVDWSGFEMALDRERERSRQNRKF